jgi:hydroxymethylglutaryl-CoA lyase
VDRLVITDVAARDGLQSQPVAVATAAKVALIESLFAAGVTSVEATSFVSPRAVPQMADAAEVVGALARSQAPGPGEASREGLRISALVPNLRGLERAAAAGVREIAVVLAATETMNRRNINLSLAEATATCTATLAAARSSALRTRAYVAVAWACPFEGTPAPDRVLALAERLALAGADEIVVADTIGAAGPAEVRSLLEALKTVVPAARIGVHFHDTRGLAVANAYAALEAGVRRFDSSVGGIGGCPFAPGAAGNVATEDLVLLARQCGFETGIDLAALVPVVAAAEQLLGRPLGGRSIAWLRRQAAAPGGAGMATSEERTS